MVPWLQIVIAGYSISEMGLPVLLTEVKTGFSCQSTYALKNRWLKYRVANVVGDTVFVDLFIRIVPLGQAGGEFIYYTQAHL